MTRIRTHITWLLIAVLTFTGHSMAIARGMSPATGMMELCTGDQVVMVHVDANGEPTGPAHICPEFSLMLMDMLSPVPSIAAPLVARSERNVLTEQTDIALAWDIQASARAPPYGI